MKHLKKFNESKDEDVFYKLDMINKDIFDCFQELTDINFEIQHLMGSNIIIEKDLHTTGSFYPEDVEETILFAIPYLVSEHGLHIENISINYVIYDEIIKYTQKNFTCLKDMIYFIDQFKKERRLIRINIYYKI